MTETFKGSDSQSENKILGPDYFGFVSREIVDLLAQSEGIIALFSERLDCVEKESGVPKKNDLTNTSLRHGVRTAGPISLFSDAIGPQLSDLAKERLKAVVRQSLFSFSKEVDSIVAAVLGICRIHSILKYKESLLKHHDSPSEANTGHPQKKPKLLATVEMDKDLRCLLDVESSKVQQLVKKHSAQLSAKIEHMKQKLDEFVSMLLSYLRPMTLTEKQKLKTLIQDLPPENLDRVAEIIQHGRTCNEDIDVDLEEKDDVTLWRLYFCVEAVKMARKLCKVE